MSDIEISNISANESKRRSRLGLGKPKKLEMLSQEDIEGNEIKSVPKSKGFNLELESEFNEDQQIDTEREEQELQSDPEEPIQESEEQPEPESEPEPEPEPKKDNKKVRTVEEEEKKTKSKKNKPKFVIEDDEENKEDERPKVSNNEEDEVIESDNEVPKKKSSKPSKPKGKYDDMTLKQLQNLTKERKVVGRSSLKNRDAIISKLEELDAQPPTEEEPKPNNKYQYMTIPQLKQLMGTRNISGRSTLKTKDAMIQKLIEADENPSTEPESSGKGIGKGGAQRHKKEKELETEEDQEINKKVAELVNMIYKTKKFAKHQSLEFKNGFMDYVQDLTKLVEDYQESCNESQ